jgi:hypothetical protein
VISNHGALEPTNVFSVGGSKGRPRASPWRRARRLRRGQTAHRVWFSFSSPTIISFSGPVVIASFSRSMPANALKAVPVPARQREQ